jgi:hypothetical protein
MRWTLYIDVDDTFLLHQKPVHNTGSFFRWCVEHFDVKWMTRWCPDGKMDKSQISYLAPILGIEPERFKDFENPLGFKWCKTEAVDWEGKPFVWVENTLFPHEVPRMTERMIKYFGNLDRFYETNLHYWDLTPDEPQAANGPENAIWRTWKKLAQDFKIKRPLEGLAPSEIASLKATGMFWEFYPEGE